MAAGSRSRHFIMGHGRRVEPFMLYNAIVVSFSLHPFSHCLGPEADLYASESQDSPIAERRQFIDPLEMVNWMITKRKVVICEYAR